MRRVIEALRLRFDQQLSQRDIARSLGLSQGSVNAYLTRFTASGLSWPLPEDLGEAELEARLFIGPSIPSSATRPLPEWAVLREELKRKRRHAAVALARIQNRASRRLSVPQFCEHYRAWAATRSNRRCARCTSLANACSSTTPGRRCRSSSPRPARSAPRKSSSRRSARAIPVYAEATWTQTLVDWIGVHVRMLEYYGECPRAHCARQRECARPASVRLIAGPTGTRKTWLACALGRVRVGRATRSATRDSCGSWARNSSALVALRRVLRQTPGSSRRRISLIA